MFQTTNFASVFPVVLLLNGIYDILCAYSILYVKNKNFFFAKIHRSMYVDDATIKEHSIDSRFVSYWIFTNGIIRLISSMDSSLYSVASVTYFTESAVFMREYMMEKMKTLNVVFVVVTSFILGVLCLYFCTACNSCSIQNFLQNIKPVISHDIFKTDYGLGFKNYCVF